ncbi:MULTISPECIES: pyruvate, water dikinase regulatory protein [unclassified Iodidimonas]|jgi:regulator of PEP synthase PpsR (kinase-PPPase family)|uniref:pyruvate, water dikinase regulatory protein n=1 Tax=unclassified Iodidimonas TaxID=2626145 RepID=UPI002482575A|nr:MULTISPECIES: pyruvate, water dikinase regulatory protein [unclassified Iodidimonas]
MEKPPAPQRFHLHLVSDSTGETLEAMAKAALVQFEDARAEKHIWPMVRTARQMERIMEFIEDRPGLVMYTLVNEDIRRELTRHCSALNIQHVSVLDPVISALGQFLGAQSRGLPGRQHEMDRDYFDRIDALHFTMAHDDGQMAHDLLAADIILVGVSRTSKTPTSIYLANKGFKTANIPFVPNAVLPPELYGPLNALVVGLTASPDRLVQVRTNRLRSMREAPSTSYVDMEAVKLEVLACRRLCSDNHWPVIDVTRRSIEETAAAILRLHSAREASSHQKEKE